MTTHEHYDNYLEEHEREIGSLKGSMSFEEFCEFYEVNENTSEEELRDVFWF